MKLKNSIRIDFYFSFHRHNFQILYIPWSEKLITETSSILENTFFYFLQHNFMSQAIYLNLPLQFILYAFVVWNLKTLMKKSPLKFTYNIFQFFFSLFRILLLCNPKSYIKCKDFIFNFFILFSLFRNKNFSLKILTLRNDDVCMNSKINPRKYYIFL